MRSGKFEKNCGKLVANVKRQREISGKLTGSVGLCWELRGKSEIIVGS